MTSSSIRGGWSTHTHTHTENNTVTQQNIDDINILGDEKLNKKTQNQSRISHLLVDGQNINIMMGRYG